MREVIEASRTSRRSSRGCRGEFHRGSPPDLAGAGRALAHYDGRALAPEVDVPCAVVVTTTDQLVRPEKQYELADALDADTFALDGDHFAPFNRGPASPRPSPPPSTRSPPRRALRAAQPSLAAAASATILSARWDGAGS